MPSVVDTLAELGDTFDPAPDAYEHYERRVATKGRLLDIGGRNSASGSAARLRELGARPENIVSTDIFPTYNPDLVDDITATTVPAESFDAVYCSAVLEHVTTYWTALEGIHSILKPGGEAFIYVPFVFGFHDAVDHHRFTITEVARMVSGFSESKVFLPPDSGYGFVVGHVLSYGRIEKVPALSRITTRAINALLTLAANAIYTLRRERRYTREQFARQLVHFNFNHGFCAWVKK